jgi:hypothetical protein
MQQGRVRRAGVGMKLYSDKLTDADIFNAARTAGVELYHCEPIGNTRVRRYGWEISLSGSSPYTSQSNFTDPHKAATWCEHGIFMAELYKVDPKLRIANYKTLADFMETTRKLSEHPGNNIGKRAKHFRAPWLEDEELKNALSFSGLNLP